MSQNAILEEFLVDIEECDAGVIRRIDDLMREEWQTDHLKIVDFRRFTLLLDFRECTAILEDDLDVSGARTLTMPLSEFRSWLLDQAS